MNRKGESRTRTFLFLFLSLSLFEPEVNPQGLCRLRGERKTHGKRDPCVAAWGREKTTASPDLHPDGYVSFFPLACNNLVVSLFIISHAFQTVVKFDSLNSVTVL